jgi:hypothetical protein
MPKRKPGGSSVAEKPADLQASRAARKASVVVRDSLTGASGGFKNTPARPRFPRLPSGRSGQRPDAVSAQRKTGNPCAAAKGGGDG